MLYEQGFHDPDFEKKYVEFFDYLDNYFEKYKDEFKWEDYQQRSLDKLYHFVKTTLWNINFHDLAMEFFGDDSKSPAELRRLSIDQNRGFIYVAWSEHFKEIWKKDSVSVLLILKIIIVMVSKASKPSPPSSRARKATKRLVV